MESTKRLFILYNFVKLIGQFQLHLWGLMLSIVSMQCSETFFCFWFFPPFFLILCVSFYVCAGVPVEVQSNPELDNTARPAGQLVQEMVCLLSLAQIRGKPPCIPSTYECSRDPNSGPLGCVTAKLSPQSLFSFLSITDSLSFLVSISNSISLRCFP